MQKEDIPEKPVEPASSAACKLGGKIKKVRFSRFTKTTEVITQNDNLSMLQKYHGSCHCGAVRFEVVAPRKLPVFDCNCSICHKKQAKQFLVPASRFQLLTGHTETTTYTFGTHQAKHMFCAKCGIQSFFIPRANPNVIGMKFGLIFSLVDTMPRGNNYKIMKCIRKGKIKMFWFGLILLAVMPHCLDSPLPLKVQTELFDGRNWEQAIKKSNLPDVPKN